MALQDLRFNITAVDETGAAFKASAAEAAVASRAVAAANGQSAVAVRTLGKETERAVKSQVSHNAALGIGQTQMMSLMHAGRGATEMLAQGVPVTRVLAMEMNNLAYALMGPQGVIAALKGAGASGALRGIGTAINAIPGPLKVVGLAVGAAAAGFMVLRNWINATSGAHVSLGNTVKATFQVIGGAIGSILSPAVAAIGRVVAPVWNAIGEGAHTVGNAIIGTFVAAYKVISTDWAQLPNFLGSATVQAANAVIAGGATMVNAAAGLLNKFVDEINKIPGVNIGRLGTVGFGQIANPFADALAASNKGLADQVKSAMSTNYLGNFAGAIKTKAIADQAAVTDAVKGTSKAVKAAKTEIDEALKAAIASLDNFRSTARDVLGTFFSDLEQKKGIWTAFADAAVSALHRIEENGLDKLVDLLFGAKGSTSGGLFGGSFLSSIGHLLGFASGGSVIAGGAGGPDSQLFAARVTPGERIDFTPPGKSRGAGGGEITVRLISDVSPMLTQHIQATSADVAVKVVTGVAQKQARDRALGG